VEIGDWKSAGSVAPLYADYQHHDRKMTSARNAEVAARVKARREEAQRK